MRNIIEFILFLSCLISLNSCQQDNEEEVFSRLEVSVDTLRFSGIAQDTSFQIEASAVWKVEGMTDWCTVSPTNGTGNGKVSLSLKTNDTGNDRSFSLTFSMGSLSQKLVVYQWGFAHHIVPSTPSLECPLMNAENMPIYANFRWVAAECSDGSSVSYVVSWSENQQKWIESEPVTTTMFTVATPLTAHKKYFWKVTAFSQDGGKAESSVRSFITGETLYADGHILTLEKNKEKNPINLIFMGDGFIREDYDNGTFELVIKEAIAGFFSRPPYTTYRKYFNVYGVVAFSTERGASDQYTKRNTVFRTLYTGEVEGKLSIDIDGVYSYAKKVPAMTKLEETPVIVIVNDGRFAGSTFMELDGRAVSVCPRIKESNNGNFGDLIAHEAGGHAFGMLADEYVNWQEELPEARRQIIERHHTAGWYQNIDLTNDPKKVRWKHFIGRVGYETTGIVEGGFYYSKGVWRPQAYSCMRYNRYPYNAPSREAIVKRIFSIAKEEYSFEKFLEKDVKE
ncbi:MAG: M64 family metallopeptidase [Odoribacter sp.]